MFRARTPILAAALLAIAALPAAGEPVADRPLESIFNGRDLTGWKPPQGAFWRVEKGTLVGENDAALKGSMLYTDRDYGDVVVEADVRFDGEIDSGIMLRKPEVQVQIGVSRSLKRDMTCSFYTGTYPEAARAERAGGKPQICINGRRLEPHMAKPLFDAELARNKGLYEADMPVQLVIFNALSTAYSC